MKISRRNALTALAVVGAPFLARATTSDVEEDRNQAQGFAYVVSYLKGSSLLFGTLHGGIAGVKGPSLARMQKIATSKRIFIEADTQPSQRMDKLFEKYAEHKPNDGLTRYLGAHTSDQILARLKLIGIDEAQAKKLRPWLIQTILPVAKTPGDPTADGRYGVDQEFLKNPLVQMIPVQELEGAEAQFRMFAAASDSEQYQRLADRLELIESGFENEYHLNVINAWITSDLDRIAAGIEKLVRTRNNYANFYVRDLLDRRNRLFCNKMLSVMTQETGISTFIVGSEHLAGPRGVLALLRGRGAIVRPI